MAILKSLIVNGVARIIGDLTASKIIKQGGVSSEFLKADGSVDSTSYYHSGNKPSLSDLGAASSSHTHSYLPLSGGTITGSLTFANGTWNVVGDDAAIGDYNVAGSLGLKSVNNNIPSIGFHNSSNTLLGTLKCDEGTLKWNTNTIWHAGNDGSGSGLDADTLDGNHASAFATAGHTHDYLPFYCLSSADCNTMSQGLTAVGASASNQNASNHSAFLTITDIGTPFQLQIPDSDSPYIYKRCKSGSSWSSWSKLSAGYADSAGTSSYVTVTPSTSTSAYKILFHSGNTICSNGTLSVVPSSGNVTSNGNFYANSDIRYKNIIEYHHSLSDKIAQLPIIKYKWIDRDDNSVHIGSSALSVMSIIPELVSYDDNIDFYSLDYATLGAVAGISACREVETLKLRIQNLEQEIIFLKSKYNG